MPNLTDLFCDGRSTDIHRLVIDFDRDDPYLFRDVLANRKLAEAMGGPRSSVDVLTHLFAGPPAAARVPFLPRDRLLSAAERRAAEAAFAETLATGETTSGRHVARFEDEIAAYLGIRHVIGASSGTDALTISLVALGIGPGDEVIIPANSFAATENAVLATRAVAVLADVGPDDGNLDPAAVAAVVTGRTRAIVPVHFNGRLADLPALRAVADAHGLWVVEDACQAIGLRGVGENSHAVALSFNPFKNFGLPGKAGAVLTDDDALAARCREIGYHGFVPGRKNEKRAPFGLNARIDNTLAAVGLALLPYLSLNNFKRAYLARRYAEALRPLRDSGRLAVPEFTAGHVWHLFAVQVLDGPPRDAVRADLLDRHGVETDVYYPVLTHRQRTWRRPAHYASASLPVTERVHARQINLPLHHHLTLVEQDRIAEAVHAVLR